MDQTNLESPQSLQTNRISLKNILILLIFSLIIVILTASTTYFVLQSRQTPQIPVLPTSSRPSPTVSVDETAKWKKYTNAQHGYSVKYPSNWKEQIKCEGGITDDDYICFLSSDFQESNAGAVMGSTQKGGLILIEGQNNKRLVGQSFNGFCQPGETANVTNCKETTVAGLQVWRRELNGTQTQVGVVKNGKFIVEIEAVYNISSKNVILNTLDQILSTFKFLDQNQNTATISP